jgi:hypothetical protein
MNKRAARPDKHGRWDEAAMFTAQPSPGIGVVGLCARQDHW